MAERGERVRVHRPGGYDRLKLETFAPCEPMLDEVLVRTSVVGVNYADCVVRMGLYSSAKKYVGWPITPGFEFAGRVLRTGANVNDVRNGERVFGVTRFDGYATHVTVPRAQLFAPPDGFDDAQAAAFPAVFLTAWYALVELAAARAGATVLVHAAAGGVGGALVQLAARRGCRVVGVVGASHKVDVAREAGASVVVDRSVEDLWAAAERVAPDGFDAVFDANGVATLRQSYRHLASPGRLVIYGFHSMLPRRGGRPHYARLALDYVRTPRFDPLGMTSDNRSVMAFNLSYLFDRSDLLAGAMTELLDGVAKGEIRAPRIETHQLRDVAEAHRRLESAQTVGKLVLRTDA